MRRLSFLEATLLIQTAEYLFANRVNDYLRSVSRTAKWMHGKVVSFVGAFDSCLTIRNASKEEEYR